MYDEEDRTAEAEINANLDEIGGMAGRLKQMAVDMNDELKYQNQLIDDVGGRAEKINERLNHMNRKVKKIG